MNKFKINPLKIAATVVAVAGYFITKEISRRELEETVDKKLDERGYIDARETEILP